MRTSEFLKLRLPERKAVNDVADIEDLTFDMEKLDAEAARQKLTDDSLETSKANVSEFNTHKAKPILDHPDNSVTDAKIGERSIGTSKGMLQALLDALGSAINAITGNATWSELPAVTLAATKLHIDSKENPHATTKAQVGLGNTDNTSDANKPVSTAQAAAIKAVQDDVTAHKANAQNPHATTAEQVGAYTKAAIDAKDKAVSDAATAHYSDNDRHINSGERPKWNDKYTKSEVDNKFSMLETNTDWKESVATFADIAKTYPTPQDGWTVNTRDTDYTYRYSGTQWVVISANAIPKATTSVDGLQTKENVADVTANTANRHNHNNKAVLDTITNVLINTWNTVTEKLNLSGGTLTGDLILNAAPTANLQAANKKYVDDIASGKGNGDMLKTVYDANNDGIVDNSEKVNGLTVLSAVPSGAKFTDTIYTHPNTHPYSMITGTPTALPPNGAAGGDLSGSYPNPTVSIKSDLNVPNVLQNGRTFLNVVTWSRDETVNEIVIKTKIPYISGNIMPLIHIKGYAYGEQAPVELSIGFYIYGNQLGWCGCISTCPWKPTIKLSSYIENGSKYVAVSLIKDIYYCRFTVDFTDIWKSGDGNWRDYSKGWTVIEKLSSTSGTIVPQDDIITVSYKPIANDIIGNSSTSTKLLTPRSINGVNFDGTANITVSMDGGTY